MLTNSYSCNIRISSTFPQMLARHWYYIRCSKNTAFLRAFTGQSDIKKLRRENEMLKKEIWCLRDGYDKLERLIKEKGIDSSSSSSTCSSSSDSVCINYINIISMVNLAKIIIFYLHLSIVSTLENVIFRNDCQIQMKSKMYIIIVMYLIHCFDI